MVTPLVMYRRLPSLTQRSRRIAVLATFLGFPLQLVGYAFLIEPGRLAAAIWAPVSILLFSATVFGAIAVGGYGQGRFDRRSTVDERQRAMVDRAMIVSYAVLTTAIVVVGGVIAVYASFVGPVVIEMGAFSPWLIALGLYVPFLPFGALAWLEPDAPVDDEA